MTPVAPLSRGAKLGEYGLDMTKKTTPPAKKAARPPAKKAAAKAPAKKAARAPAKKAASSMAGFAARKAPATGGGFSTYVGQAPTKARANRGFKAPAKKASSGRVASSGRMVAGDEGRRPNSTTLAAMAEVSQLVAAFKKRHGLS